MKLAKLTNITQLDIHSWFRITWRNPETGRSNSALYPGDMVRSAEAAVVAAGYHLVSTELHEVEGWDRDAA